MAHCNVRQKSSFTLTTKTFTDKPQAAELHTQTHNVSLYLGLEAEDCDRHTHHYCYSHGQKHCFSFIVAAKETYGG